MTGPALKVVWQSFEGRYSDNPCAVYRRWREERPHDTHVWLAHPRHLDAFPSDVATVPIYEPASVAALEDADVLVANTHTDVEWHKRDDAFYVQTWHGTPLKRIHRDVLWAPPGRLDRLSLDVARWDLLLSPNPASTPRLRRAFQYDGEILQTGYPRNDLLNSPERTAVRRRVRESLGIPDHVQAILYTPTWRDDAVFADDDILGLELDAKVLLKQLGDGHCVLVRAHPLVSDRLATIGGREVLDVSRHPDVAELYLAADVMVTDYSSTMFDFAVTGKPLVFFAYDLDRFRDSTRGFYFDLGAEAPGPLVSTQEELAGVLLELPEHTRASAAAYAAFQQRYCGLEDGHASDRVLTAILHRVDPSTRRRRPDPRPVP